MKLPSGLLTLGLLALSAAPAAAGIGQPSPWQLGFQGSVTEIMSGINSFHNLLLWLITFVVLFVLALLVYVMVRFNEKANPTPSRTTHNTTIEVLWTVVPVLILVVIAIPSFRLLYAQYDPPAADLTVKVTGHQWYWNIEYQNGEGDPADAAEIAFDAIMLQDAERQEGQPRLLAVDNDMVVPVGRTVRVLVTAADVLHAFAVPSFGVKVDAVPGRMNETWFRAEREGMYYGQCSELCGRDHAFMPIAVRVVSDEEYTAWLQEARQRFAVDRTAPARAVADARTTR